MIISVGCDQSFNEELISQPLLKFKVNTNLQSKLDKEMGRRSKKKEVHHSIIEH